ncbi:helix-turn-helix domain-containing protein [Solibacillus sp. FSL R7-0682]
MRRTKGITLKELSQHMNVSIAYISYFEKGKRNFDSNKLTKYSNYIIKK